MAVQVEGSWIPTSSIAYGVALITYLPPSSTTSNVTPAENGTPSTYSDQDGTSAVDSPHKEDPNPHQVPLEVGDEVYVFEVFRPATSLQSTWYRGYVVSTSPNPKLPLLTSSADPYAFSSADAANAPLAEEPQVSVGIFPASHVQIREELDDADRRLSAIHLPGANGGDDGAGGRRPSSVGVPTITMRDTSGRMAPLKEEDEEEDDFGLPAPGGTRVSALPTIHTSPLGATNGAPAKSNARNRASVGSISSITASQISHDQNRQTSYDNRPAPPLPNLKCGDETISGATEPLVDEIACALREWASLLYTHLYRHNYELFYTMKNAIEILHGARRQLLAKTLSIEEMAALRKDCVSRLVRGNIEQNLDVIVRHPVGGALVEVGVPEKGEEVDPSAWVSAVRMYAMQVALAYSTTPGLEGALATGLHTSDLATLPNSASNPRLTAPNAVNLPNTNPSASIQTRGSIRRPSAFSVAGSRTFPSEQTDSAAHVSVTATGAKFYHAFVDVRAFAANFCGAGEAAELYFSLFNKADARYVTEEFCVILGHNGSPVRGESGGGGAGQGQTKMRTLFRDLSHHDVQDQLFLVCRIVKNGSLKLGPAPPVNGMVSPAFNVSSPNVARSETDSLSSSVSQTGVDFGLGTSSGMLSSDGRTGRQSYRRPFGCAVLEISQFNKVHSADPAEAAGVSASEHQMPIFVPVTEAAFSTLHEDIIASRIREIEKSPRADHVAVNVRIMYGEAAQLIKENPALLGDVPLTQRLGFPDVVFPGDQRNEVYLKLWSGDFSSSSALRGGRGFSAPGGKNIEVGVEIRTREGALVDRVISRGAGEPPVTQYSSMVFKGNNLPTWGELVKLDIPADLMEQCHIFFTFRARGIKSGSTSAGLGGEKPFAFAYLPLFLDNAAFVPDGSHSLVLYRYEKSVAIAQFYFQAPPTQISGTIPHLPPSVIKTLIPLRDSMVVRSFLVSTRYTQDITLLKLIRWETQLAGDTPGIKEVLSALRFCSEVEMCKFLRDIFDALFGILISAQNQTGDCDDLVFQALVTILSIVSDRRFTNFKPVLDVYIERHFNFSTASSHIIKSLHKLLRNPSDPASATTFRSSIKVWHYLFKFIVRSREIQRAKDVGMGVTSDHLETTFKRELAALLQQINSMMRLSSPSSVIGTQTLAIQHFASIIPDVAKCFTDQELADIAIAFGDSITAPKGKIAIWKLLLLNQLVHSVIFDSATGRAALVPNIVRWLKPSLGKFDENLMFSAKDPQATRDLARVGWVEGVRLAVGVVAVMIDRIQEAFVDPAIRNSRSLLGQEQDSVEYILAIVPRLLDSYRELESSANLEAVVRQRSLASVVLPVPVIFPSAYPFSLLARSATESRAEHQGNTRDLAAPSLQSGVGEIACVFLALLLLAPRKIFVNFLEGTLEIEGKDNFARLLTSMFRVSKSILENDAFPADWLNINILAHRVVIMMVEPVASILERDFIPSQQASFTFNTALWRDFFAMLLKLLSSPQLLIEEFSPQKRRAVWRSGGDIRGQGASILLRLWNAIGWPEDQGERPGRGQGRHGGFQVQFVPGLVEDVLSLCLSHHDELRTSAVHVLFSMIVSEYYLNDDFAVIEAEVIDRLDKLFMSQTKGDEISRAFFVGQLKGLFDEADIEDRLREQVAAFLASVNSFLDLLLAVRNLPEGEEYQEDRIISTLKLMSFIRGIGRSEIYIRYVNRLVSYHVALGNETEAGLTLKLHADLYDWNLTTFVDPMPDLDLPQQTEFARKETLVMRILAHLSKGKAWETAIDLCKELQREYETKSYNYVRLSELLILQSELYASIVQTERHFGEFFRVAFYGNRFPLSVCGKQFIYRGVEWEKLGAFSEKMLNKHPGATLLKTSTIPPEDVQYGDGQFLQITAVAPEPEADSPIFTNPDVPPPVRAYHQYNGTHTFTFTRPINKDPTGRVRVANDFTSLWTEKTVLICEDSFPTVLRRSEVVEIRIVEISPLENALNDVQNKTKELRNLEQRYHALGQTEPDHTKINTNALSMLLNGAVDAPVNQGIPMYRKAFFGSDFMALNPDKATTIKRLQTSVDDLVVTISRCMKLHGALCPPEMQPFHETLERFFEKNFSEEIGRLPVDTYEPTFASPALSKEDAEDVAPLSSRHARANGSISITNHPAIRHSSIDLSYARRDSTATVRSSVSTIKQRNGSVVSTVEEATPTSKTPMAADFHIPPISPIAPSAARTPSFYASSILSDSTLDAKDSSSLTAARNEVRKASVAPSPTKNSAGALAAALGNTSVASPMYAKGSTTSLKSSASSFATGNGSAAPSGTTERRGSVLGSLRWKRKMSLFSSDTVSEE